MIHLEKKTLVISGAVLVVAIAIFLLFDVVRPKTPDWITATVERGSVSEIVSVSGFVEAKNTAELAFPNVGIVTFVYAHEGMEVKAGEVLATLGSGELIAQRNEALANIEVATARYDKLQAGADSADRSIAETSLQNAEQALERTKSEEAEKVAKAKRTLLSSDLEALATDPNKHATAPTVSGTYTCEAEGAYTIEVYNSNAYSGYSYRATGLENVTGTVTTDQPSRLGECGLYLQFSDNEGYGTTEWVIEVPNTHSSTYLTYANAYELALQAQINAVAQAEDERALAALETESVLDGPRSEEVREARAAVNQAYAALAQVDALLSDRSITAPFDGVVTTVDIVKGETAGSDPVITMLASDAFTLTARIPEIDITKLKDGQHVTAVFDAAPEDIQEGTILYISPLATIIDGVAYFEATIDLTQSPQWLRSGLNADVDITIKQREDVLRIPKRFIIDNEDGTFSVQTSKGSRLATTTIRVEFSGNDGFSEIIGLNEGDVVVAP